MMIAKGGHGSMDQKKVGAFMKELRNEKQLTQEQLAEMFGVTNRSVSRWENGVNMPDFDVVIEMANYYDVSIEEILDEERRKEMVDKEDVSLGLVFGMLLVGALFTSRYGGKAQAFKQKLLRKGNV